MVTKMTKACQNMVDGPYDFNFFESVQFPYLMGQKHLKLQTGKSVFQILLSEFISYNDKSRLRGTC